MQEEVKKFFDKWDYQKNKMTIPIVDHHMEPIKYKLMDVFKVKTKGSLQKFLMIYCYVNYKNNFMTNDKNLKQMMEDHKNYKENRKQAGVIAITKNNKVLLFKKFRQVWLPKGKEDYYDTDLKATGIRELKEEGGKNF